MAKEKFNFIDTKNSSKNFGATKSKNKLDFVGMEKRIKELWEKEKIFKFDKTRKGKIYSVDTPPPTVSGKMHIGHAFSYSQQDFIVRFRRMTQNVFYPFGTDDNGLPTERLIEKLKNVKSKDMSRADFIELCLNSLKEITPDFIQDWKDLGISCDYEKYYSTINKPTQKLSQKSFLDLYKKGEVYKDKFPTLWCPECQTAIAQAELEDKEDASLFSTLKFKCENEDLLIATTRPELLGACVAVFVNPKDDRYKKFAGKFAKVPLFNFKVPIIEDESAEMEKGTGVLMICSYGDKFDVEAINRHKLNPKIILNTDGTMNEEKYSGLKIKEARKKILEDLKKADLIKEQKQISHVVNVHDKCGTDIEFVATPQWFIKLLDKKDKLIEQGKKIKWYPEFMRKRYENWVNGLEWDWSISRDRHFGIPIPLWECEKCNEIILPNEDELPVDPLQTKKKCPKCNEIAKGEAKVLDTWMTSSITPQIATSLMDGEVKIPYSLRPQAHDIIRTWAFYTIVKSYLHEDKIPWKDIVISGNVSLKGEKMSKSKGNVIYPKIVMEEYGSDALRFWAAGSKLGNDLNYQEKDLVTGKKFVNKLLNASKFVFMNLEDFDFHRSVYPKLESKGAKSENLEVLDKEFLKKLNGLVQKCTKAFEVYEYSKAKAEVENFFWHDFCDNYLEIVKKRVYQGKGEKKHSAQYTLYKTVLTILKLIAPIMPFITEEIYQNYFKSHEDDESIHLSKWPSAKDSGDEKSEIFEILDEKISKIRQFKSSHNVSLSTEVKLTIPVEDQQSLKPVWDDFLAVSGASHIQEGKKFKIELSKNL